MRFYPNVVPPFPFEPDTTRFEIRTVPGGQGEGLVSLTSFEPRETVAAFTGFLVPEVSISTLQLGPGRHIHDPYFMGKVLHHCDPNMVVDLKNLKFIACRPIRPGDVISIDYEVTEERLFSHFNCSCDAPDCRRVIKGKSVR